MEATTQTTTRDLDAAIVANLASPQVKTVFDHMRAKGSISNVEAQAIYRIRALPRRIKDLKDIGVMVRRELKVDPTGQRYARYTLG